MSPPSYRAAPPRGDCRSVPDTGEAVNPQTASHPGPGHKAVPRIGPLAAGGEVLRLDRGDLVDRQLALGKLGLEAVQARAVAGEDRALHRAVGGAKRLEAVLLLHVLRDLEPAHRLDLPLG